MRVWAATTKRFAYRLHSRARTRSRADNTGARPAPFYRLAVIAARAISTSLAALAGAVVLAGCGASGPGTQQAPVVTKTQATAVASSARMTADGWQAMSGYKVLIHDIGGRARNPRQATKLHDNEHRCLQLGGSGPQAVAIRSSCIDDFAFGRAAIAVDACIDAGEDNPALAGAGGECLIDKVTRAANAAQDASVSGQRLADTLTAGRCRDIFTNWATVNDRMAKAFAKLVRRLRDTDGVTREAYAAFQHDARRSSLSGVTEFCAPAGA
jgi:hypothetical protein